MIFNLLKRISDLEKVAVPFIWTKEDRDILIAVGAAQEDGQALGLKQLTLLGVGATATLRRRLVHLIDSGYLEKVVHRNDRRVVVYVVSDPIMRYMQQLGDELLAELAKPSGNIKDAQRH